MTELTAKHCKPCEGGVEPLTRERANELRAQVLGWDLSADANEISRSFKFNDFLKTMAFVNAVAWIAEAEGHHPDMEVSWGRAHIRFSTHSIGGLSENDFICAAKVSALTG